MITSLIQVPMVGQLEFELLSLFGGCYFLNLCCRQLHDKLISQEK